MKTKKTKNKRKTATTKRTRVKEINYPAHYLAIILMSAMVIEGVLFGVTTETNWAYAAEVLDASEAASQTADDMALVFQPISDTAAGVNEFYVLAANELIPLLDMNKSLSDVAMIWDGVNAFYDEASIQMAQVLDISAINNWPAAVAGVSIEK